MKSFIKNILFVTLPIFLVLFAFVETYVRISKEKVDLYELTGRKPTVNPMSEWAKTDAYSAFTAIPGQYSKNKTVNSQGFISTPEISLQKNENKIRIIFLGGSSTAGTGINLPDEETWPWKTIKKLKDSLKTENIDFINAALGGYSTYESYGRLWSRLRFYKPDIVILYQGWNDMYYFKNADNPLNWRKDFDLQRPMKVEKIAKHWIDPFVRPSQLLTRIRLIVIKKTKISGEFQIDEKSKKDEKSFNRKGLDIFRDNLKLIRDFCENNNIQFYMCKQATLVHPKTPEEDRKKCSFTYHNFEYDAHIVAYDSLYRIIDNEIEKSHIIDVTSISGKPEYFYDHVHPNIEGTDVISKIVNDSLINNFFK